MFFRLKLAVCLVSVTLALATGCGRTADRSPSEPAAPAALSDSSNTGATAVEAGQSVAAAGGISTSAAEASECFWPRFHGPGGDNISPDAGLLKKWPQGGPPMLWTTEGIGEGYSSVSIAAGRIYTAGNIGDETTVTALDMEGRIVWQAPNGKAWTKSYEGTRGTPTIDGPRLYHQSPLGRLACFEAVSGKEIWSRNVLEEFGADNIRWALAESVLVEGDHVFSCPGGPQVSAVALDKMTGQTVWKAPSSGDVAGYATLTLAEFEGRRMLLTMSAKAAIAVDADAGELLWRWPHETRYDVNVLKPLYHAGQVFISSGYGAGSELLTLSSSGGKVTVEQAWSSEELDNHHGGVVLFEGRLYGAASQANKSAPWICLDWKTGQMVYAKQGVGKGSLTCADGMLYTLSETRDVGLAEATPAGHKLAGRFQIPAGGSGASWAHPVVCGGRLYIRHGNFLYAYNVRGPQ